MREVRVGSITGEERHDGPARGRPLRVPLPQSCPVHQFKEVTVKALLAIVVLLFPLLSPTVYAQDQQWELTQVDGKNQKALKLDSSPSRSPQWTRPISRNADNPLRIRIIQGGVYTPTHKDGYMWLRFACTTDTLDYYNGADHGSLVHSFRVTAYSKTGRKIYDTNDATDVSGGAGACWTFGFIDTTFVEVPEDIGRQVARVLAIPERTSSNIIVDRIEYNALYETQEVP